MATVIPLSNLFFCAILEILFSCPAHEATALSITDSTFMWFDDERDGSSVGEIEQRSLPHRVRTPDVRSPYEHNFSQLTRFPTTRFYGSKRKQLEWLSDELKPLEGTTALDAFGGTGAVTHLLGQLGWETTYNDIFEFNTISAKALFSKVASFLPEERILKFVNDVEPRAGFISNIFAGMFFTDAENMWLDGFMQSVRLEPEPVKSVLLHCLFQACLKKRPFNLFHRANLKLRESKVPVQFGNRSTWAKPFSDHILETYYEIRVFQNRPESEIIIAPAGCASKIGAGFDLVYLDPPYFKRAKRNTETYLERYHFLEGLARYDDWPGLIDMKSPIRSLRRPYRPEWANKLEMLENLQKLFKNHVGAKFVLSYVSDEEPTEHELFGLFRANFDRVRLSRRSFAKALSKKESFELLLIGQ